MGAVKRKPRTPAPPNFSLAEATPLDTMEVREALAHIPQHPKPFRRVGNWPMMIRSVTEYLTQTPEWMVRVRGRFTGYPRPFRKVRFKSWDGTPLTAWLGVHQRPLEDGQRSAPPLPREGIVIVPGMFTTKDNALQKARALKIFTEWGYHVLSLDLRGMGESSRTFNTGGWKESEDVEAAVDFLRANAPVEKVHIYAESLGATAAILAAARQAQRGFRLVDGGILAVCPFADARRVIHHLGHKPESVDEFYMVRWFFLQLLRLKGTKYPTFEAYLKAAAQHYGVSLAHLYKRSSPRHVLTQVNVPLLVISSRDDPIVPPAEMRTFQHLLKGRRNPTVWTLPWGSHCLFELEDPEWFWTLLREFFDFYCLLPPAH